MRNVILEMMKKFPVPIGILMVGSMLDHAWNIYQPNPHDWIPTWGHALGILGSLIGIAQCIFFHYSKPVIPKNAYTAKNPWGDKPGDKA